MNALTLPLSLKNANSVEQYGAALDSLKRFVTENNKDDAFILSGSAGTGKTSLLKEFTEFLDENNIDFKLLAPTGQAAKVVARRTGKVAGTLHSAVYTINEEGKDEIVRYEFLPRINRLIRPCVFIVDEASMISDLPANNELFVSKNSVLYDFLQFYKKSPNGSKVVFVGDSFQLPPVMEAVSGALSEEYLYKKHHINSKGFQLTEVFRQKSNSSIYNNALILKKLITKKLQYMPDLQFRQMYRADLAINRFCEIFNPKNEDYAIFLGWKNSTIDKLNNVIRNKLFQNPSEILHPNEQIILGRSYYKDHYLPSGTIGKVISYNPYSVENIAETKFAEATLRFEMAGGDVITISSKVNLDFLLNGSTDEDPKRIKKLWADRKKTNKLFRETNNPADDPYLSAFKIKYGYAITTHKAQGGEWQNVFLYPEFPKDENRLKWIYTAVTRASEELYSF